MMDRIDNIKNYFKTALKSSLLKNYGFVLFFQLINFSVPLVVTPYLISIVGISNFGEITYSFGLMTFLSVFTEYGFNLTATRDIAINRNDNKKLSRIYTNTIFAKIILFLIGFFVASIAIYFININAGGQGFNRRLHLLSIVYVVGQTILPYWVFQGLEKLFLVSIINALTKMLYVYLVFLLVNKPEDYVLANFLLGVSIIINSILLHLILYIKYRISFVKTKMKYIVVSLREGWDIFLSTASINLYSGGANVFVLSLFANTTLIGYYGIVEKLINISKQPISIFIQVVYPKACMLADKGFSEIQKYVWNVVQPFFVVNLFFSIVIFSQSSRISYFFLKVENISVINLIKLSAILPFSVSFNLTPYISLLAHGYTKEVSKTIVSVALFSLVLNLTLSYIMLASGTVLSMIITEALIALGLYVFARKKINSHGAISSQM